ncbi:hypothetical protein Ahia01_001356700 [Argonauta hians]
MNYPPKKSAARSSNRIGNHGFSGGWRGPNTKDRDKPYHDDKHKNHQDRDYKYNHDHLYDYHDQYGKDHLKHCNKANYQDDHLHYSDNSYDDYSHYNDFQRYPRRQNHDSQDYCRKPPKNEKKDFSRSVIIVIPEIRKKTDLVKKFQKIQNYWKCNKLPGETKRSPTQMIRNELSGPKDDKNNNNKKSHSRKCFVPNSYVIPTEKPRYNLCWKIRSDMAHGNMPRTI